MTVASYCWSPLQSYTPVQIGLQVLNVVEDFNNNVSVLVGIFGPQCETNGCIKPQKTICSQKNKQTRCPWWISKEKKIDIIFT